MTFVASHRVPAAGMATWPRPDPNVAEGPRLAPSLEISVRQYWAGWAEVECSNGWTAWVDANQLLPLGATRGLPAARSGFDLDAAMLCLGAALVVLGGFLAWFTGPGVSIDAWDTPLKFLFVDRAATGGPDAGPFLLVALVAPLPLLALQRLPWGALLAVSVLALAAPVAALVRIAQLDNGPDPGIGIFVTLVGALVLGGEAWRHANAAASVGARRAR